MGIDEACGDEGAAVIMQARLRVTAAQVIGGTRGGDAAIFDEDGAVAFVMGGGFARLERIGGEAEHLPQKKIGHLLFLFRRRFRGVMRPLQAYGLLAHG